MALREEFRVDLGIVETGHRTRVEPDRPQRQDEIGDLERAVLEGAARREGGVAREPGLGVGMGKQERQMLEELLVMGRDRDNRGHLRFLEIPGDSAGSRRALAASDRRNNIRSGD